MFRSASKMTFMEPLPPIRVVRVDLYALRNDEGGRMRPFLVGYKPTLYVNDGVDSDCVVSKVEGYGGYDEVPQGKELNAEILYFQRSPPVAVGDTFELREGARVSARGRIRELLDNET
jgi:translation elongation factor EF-Tu-like GTPase